jgi:serine/threonine protein kinase
LHSKYNIAHLDIKPENMMRCPNELTKTTEKTNLIDFGAVKYSKGESSMTAGTLQYLPLSKNNYYYYPDDLFQVDWQAFRLTILALFDAYSTTEKERLTASFYINGNPFKEGLSTIAKGLTVDGKNK